MTLSPLHVSLFERTDSGFNNMKSQRLLANGDVAFATCLDELLLILSTPAPRKPKIVKFEQDSVTIAHDRYRLFTGMLEVDAATVGHDDFGYEFRVCEHWQMGAYELFTWNLSALSNLFVLHPHVPMSNRIEEITEKCRIRAFA